MPPSRNNIPQTQRFQKGRFFLFLTAGLRELGLRADASDLESISSRAVHWLDQGCVGWLVRPPHFEVCFGNIMYLCVCAFVHHVASCFNSCYHVVTHLRSFSMPVYQSHKAVMGCTFHRMVIDFTTVSSPQRCHRRVVYIQ